MTRLLRQRRRRGRRRRESKGRRRKPYGEGGRDRLRADHGHRARGARACDSCRGRTRCSPGRTRETAGILRSEVPTARLVQEAAEPGHAHAEAPQACFAQTFASPHRRRGDRGAACVFGYASEQPAVLRANYTGRRVPAAKKQSAQTRGASVAWAETRAALALDADAELKI